MSEPRTYFVYRAYDAAGDLLYAGMTRAPKSRARTHRYTSPWWPLAVRFRVVGPLTKERAEQVELDAIWSEGSIFNRPHSSDLPTFGLPTYLQAWIARLDRQRATAPRT